MQRMWRRGPDGEILRAAPEPQGAVEPGAGSGEGGESDAPRSGAPRSTTEKAPSAPGRARLSIGLRLGLRDTYDYLGAVLLISVGWSAVFGIAVIGGHAAARAPAGGLPGALPSLLGVFGAFAAAVLVGGPLAAGAFRFARNAAARQEPDLFDLAWGFREAPARSIRLAALHGAVGVILAGDSLFFITQKSPAAVVLGALLGYAALFWGLMMLYAWPLLVEQETGVRAIVRKSALLVLDNLGYTVGVGLIMLALTGALWISVVGGVVLWAGATAMLLTQATRELLRKYHVLPPDPTLDPIAEETTD